MKIIPLKIADLTSTHWESWQHWQGTNDELISPYFHPDFAKAVANVRDDVEVAVMTQSGETVGLFPFQRSRGKYGKPLAGRLSDYQAVIGPPNLTFNAEELVRCCELPLLGCLPLLEGVETPEGAAQALQAFDFDLLEERFALLLSEFRSML